MKIFRTKQELQHELAGIRQQNQVITLVPTMGALHEGHLSLINYAKPLTDITVCSIFVNPTQFNDPKDLEKYPRPIENDIALLESVGCDILFMPTVEEMYPENDPEWHIDLGNLDQIWEGEHRPGHFQGVTQIVFKLFDLVKPNQACFGQKDFQQVMVIQRMIDIKKLDIKLLICPIIRSEEGLALSSRNARLSEEGKENALTLITALRFIKDNLEQKSVAELLDGAKEILASNPAVELEYLSICETSTLAPVDNIETGKDYVALIAAWVEKVRLIDNILLSR
ncbi:Pantothenate synthetase [Sphingobacterium mizutaii]|uniref:Pantothenate synthetase n=2 Tax=Sphingobacterium mizutaii TaxID=1010 RepID=A0AAJ4X975_9SPHI|nr:pantoate--beta-alanine ligase [Sphingobacterium mizutaii]SDL37316.1 pantoate--beta-alanine ligase [Sphingobacterium mizutaii]SNV43292.1 Pantothenate synthetase [Sphingobacterium mizutaii]